MHGGGPGASGRSNRTLLVGSPESLRHLRRLVRESPTSLHVVGCVLLNGRQRYRTWGGPRVLGTIDELRTIVPAMRITTALVSIPLAMSELVRRVTVLLGEMDVEVRRVATLRDQLEGRAAGAITIDPTDLLHRPARPLHEHLIDQTLRGKRVLITGAGGSIGSHIARIVCRFAPEQIVLMERAENNLFEIDRRLATDYPGVSRRAILHDVTDARRTMSLLLDIAPHVVFHAAAHKHVPMMQDHPREAVINNFHGTRAIADAADAAGAERFVMISTDKAVNPTSVMGATKRLAELYVQHLAGKSRTIMSMVRFGNVLGSACSVIPIWSQQLAEGGPITVTDERMTRYFMTIPEAASLVIQAASLPQVGGSIFVLDMGDPIRIQDMAERFVRLSGLEPGRDVQIVHTGARPGEKLHEELSYVSEDVKPTAHPSISLLQTEAPQAAHMQWIIRTFEAMAHCDDRATVLAALARAIPQMQPAVEVGQVGGAGEAKRSVPEIASSGSSGAHGDCGLG
jgi:FlaA1/EpsC-like NDP-sugar epimerase